MTIQVMGEGMRVYAKISSLVSLVLLILLIIYIIIVRYRTCFGYEMCNNSYLMGYNSPIPWIIAGLVLIVGVIVLIPLFYYGWNKEPKSNGIKILTKIITILTPILIIIDLLTAKQGIFYLLLGPMIVIVLLIPLYSFGWEKNT
jgi:uncharacterized membrane protein